MIYIEILIGTAAAAVAGEKSLQNMQSALQSMLDKLRLKIDSTERAVSQKMALLDQV
jgi:hypothetical protein